MSNLDDLAKAAEEAEAANVHDRPVTDADLGETATEGAQVTLGGEAAPTNPVAPVTPAPEMQLPQPVAQPEQPAPITVQAPEPVAPIPTPDHAPSLTPFNEQITSDTASVPAPAPQVPQPQSPQPMQMQPAQTPQPMQQMEHPSAPLASGTMPGQTISPQTSTPPSHIITESFPHPTAGSDPLGGIAV